MGETFERRDMNKSVFREVNLADSIFENVNFSGATFKNVNMGGATIPSAYLADLTINSAEIRGLTISGIRIDELVEAELDRQDPDRASLRIGDVFNPDEVREVMTRLDKLRDKFCTMLRSKDADLLARRPEPDEWSAIEVVRHMVHAEDVYLNRFILQNNKPYIKLGMLPDHTADLPQFAEVGTEPTTDLEMILAAWESVHAETQKYLTGVTIEELRRHVEYADGTIGGLLQLLAHHDLLHIRQAESALALLESGL